jgi:hypothetical protein
MRSRTYRIPISEAKEGARLCLDSALGFWVSGKWVGEKAALHIAYGLFLLGIEELGKYALLQDALKLQKDTGQGELTIDVATFKSHKKKLARGRALFAEWGIDLEKSGVLLDQTERERLWFVNWNTETKRFERDLTGLNIASQAMLDELIRNGLLRMRELVTD